MLMLCNNPKKKTSRHIKQVLRIAKLQRGVMKGNIGGEKGARRSFASKEKRGDPRCGPCSPPRQPSRRQKRGRRTPVETARRPTRRESTTRIGMTAANKVEPGARGDRPPSWHRRRSFGKLKEGENRGVGCYACTLRLCAPDGAKRRGGVCCVLFACGLPLESVLRPGLLQGCDSRWRETVPLLCYAFAV
jgi:hypothetical protein